MIGTAECIVSERGNSVAFFGDAYAKPTELRRESSMPIDQNGPKDHEALQLLLIVQPPTSTN
jgi:hypothetical protein